MSCAPLPPRRSAVKVCERAGHDFGAAGETFATTRRSNAPCTAATPSCTWAALYSYAESGAVFARARELIEFARRQSYRPQIEFTHPTPSRPFDEAQPDVS
jgi:hypothetical protein